MEIGNVKRLQKTFVISSHLKLEYSPSMKDSHYESGDLDIITSLYTEQRKLNVEYIWQIKISI